MGGGRWRFIFFAFTKNICRWSIPENSWLFKTFITDAPMKKLVLPFTEHPVQK